MKLFRISLFISLVCSIQSFAADYVEDFGRKGWLSDNYDLQDRVEDFLGNGRYCNKSSKSELDEVYAGLNRVKLTESNSLAYVRNYDAMVEEFTFLETARKVADFTECQANNLKNLFTDNSKLDHLKLYALNEFQRIESTLRTIDLEAKRAEAEFDKQNTVTDSKYDNLSGTGDFIRKVKADKRKIWKDLDSLRSVLVARIPFGNRPEMRDSILKLLEPSGVISDSVFKMTYLNSLRLLSSQASTSEAFFKSIQVSEQIQLHRIDEDLKKSLVQTGQMKNALSLMNLKTDTEKDVMCRMHARYKNGPKTRQLAEIPFYFAGTYGLGRLAVFASTKALSSVALSARAAVIGLDVYELSTMVDEAVEACFQDEYIAHMQNTCSAESELFITYQEASLAQCLTMSTLAAAPVAISGGLRVRSSGGIAGVKNQATEIIVQANKRLNFFISKSDGRLIRSMLQERKLLGANAIDLETFNGLSPKQRIYLLEDIADIALSQNQANKLLTRSSKGQLAKSVFDQDLRFDPETLRSILRLNGKDKNQIALILDKVDSKGLSKVGKLNTNQNLRTILESNPKLKSSLELNQSRIKSLKLVKQDEKINAILSEVPKKMRPGFRKALEKLGNADFISRYIRSLQEETAFKMINGSNRTVKVAAKAGKLDREIMANIVKSRVTGQGRKIVVIREALETKEFNKMIGRGYIVDIAFAGTSHGKYSHLLQQDMIYGVIMKNSNISYDKLLGFFGTRAGQRVWDDMFDGVAGNALSPEWFQSNIIVPSFL